MMKAETEGIDLSVVVAAWNGLPLLRQFLASAENQTDSNGIEIIIASNFPVPETDHRPAVKVMQLSETATVPELRRHGIVAARGRVVALVEDHGILDREWCREIKKAHLGSKTVIGGSVENVNSEKPLDWAVYFYDYGKYMLPNQARQVESLSGMNISYKRGILEGVAEVWHDGFYETFVNEELKRRGHQLWMLPSAIVYHNKNYEINSAVRHCYHLARSFAARRVAGFDLVKRLLFTGSSLTLPLLLPARVVLATARKGRHGRELISALPHLTLLLSIWAYGEFCGYLLGQGRSGGRWR